MMPRCRTFTEIRQGAPGIPPALLTKRLATLERHGIIERERGATGRGWSYRLTERGLALDGPPQLTSAFMTWIRPSPYAGIAAAPRARP
jgi:DNA-binding HxlR family transcriptional regulator